MAAGQPETLKQMLLQSVQLLAADYEVQRLALPEFVHVADEVALVFDDCMSYLPELEMNGLLDKVQVAGLREIDKCLDIMSDDKSLWSLESLRASPQWAEIRKRAQRLLQAFAEEQKEPNLFWLKYVGG